MLFITGARALEEVVPVVPIAVEASVAGGLVTVLGDVYVVAPEAPARGEVVTESFEESVVDAIVDRGQRGPRGRPGHVGAGARQRSRRAGRPPVRLRGGSRRRAARVDGAVTAAPEGAATSLSRSAAGMGAAAAVSRAFGGARMVVIAAVLGTTYLGNTFQASNSVSNVLFELLAAGALSAVLVPTFVDHFRRGEGRRAEELAGGLLSIAWVLLGAVTVIGIVAAPWLARVLTTGVDDPSIEADQLALTTFLLRCFIPQVLLYALGAVTTAVLHARNRFALAAVAPIGNTIVLVIAMLAFWQVAGSDPGLDLDTTERAILAAGGHPRGRRVRRRAGHRAPTIGLPPSPRAAARVARP